MLLGHSPALPVATRCWFVQNLFVAVKKQKLGSQNKISWGLSAYAWNLLVAYFLLPEPAETATEALLQQFKNFYATFDWDKHAVSFPGAHVDTFGDLCARPENRRVA